MYWAATSLNVLHWLMCLETPETKTFLSLHLNHTQTWKAIFLAKVVQGDSSERISFRKALRKRQGQRERFNISCTLFSSKVGVIHLCLYQCLCVCNPSDQWNPLGQHSFHSCFLMIYFHSQHTSSKHASPTHLTSKDMFQHFLINKPNEHQSTAHRSASMKKQTQMHTIQSLWYASMCLCVLFASSGFCSSV